MELTGFAAIGSMATAAIGGVGFILAQSANLRRVIECGDQAVRDVESKARHVLAAATQRVADDLRRDVESLKREAYRKEEAREMEQRITAAFARVEGKLDRQGEQIGHLLALDAAMRACNAQMASLVQRLDGIRA